MAKSLKQVERETEANKPAVEPNQVWSIKKDGVALRRLRIMALHPDTDNDGGRKWIVAELPGKMRPHVWPDSLNTIPEFNLRYVFRVERKPYDA